MFVQRPGPNSTDKGFPVLVTGSPAVRPADEKNYKKLIKNSKVSFLQVSS